MLLFEQYLISQRPVSPPDATFISGFFKKEAVKAGDYFVRNGNTCAKIAFVMEGVLKTCYTYADEEIIRYFAAEQHWIGNLGSFTHQKESPESVCAISDCQLLTISYYSFQSLQRAYPDWDNVWQQISNRIESARVNPYKGIVSAKERYEGFIFAQPELAFRLSTEEIAAYLRIPHEQLLQILCELLFDT